MSTYKLECFAPPAAMCTYYFLRSAVKTFIAMYIHGTYNMCLTQMRGIFFSLCSQLSFCDALVCCVFAKKEKRKYKSLPLAPADNYIFFHSVIFLPPFFFDPKIAKKTYTFSANLLFFHF